MTTTVNASDLLDYMLEHGTEITFKNGLVDGVEDWGDNLIDGLEALNDLESKLSRLAEQRHKQGLL